jgi:uncharacterized protein YecE (DUF72 family)
VVPAFGVSMRTFVGTSGWSYKEWRGSFYPAKLPANGMLSYYAERFRAVEVNNSFYRIPSERVLAGWAEQVPAQFRFVMKASRRITHNHRLRDDDGSLAYFLRAVNPLGERLGPTLFQLPPTFQLDLSRLRGFLERLPKRWPAAVEFRHPSWFVDEIYELLRSRDVPLVIVDEDREDGEGAPLVPTASWGYLRLRRGNYSSADLASWADRIETQGWTDVYMFLKHEEGSSTGPAAAQELNAILTARER